MTSDSEQQRQDIMALIIKEASRLTASEQPHFETFVRAYYRRVSLNDLKERSPVDLYGAALSHWQLLKKHEGSAESARVYNPQFEQHGWQSEHTIVEIVHESMPFLVDSVRSELSRRGFFCHLMIHISDIQLIKDKAGNIKDVLIDEQVDRSQPSLSVIYVEINRQVEEGIFDQVTGQLARVLADVRACVEDWPAMTAKLDAVIEEVSALSIEGNTEAVEFLNWLKSNHFTFLGYYKIDLAREKEDVAFQMSSETGLGVLRNKAPTISYRLSDLPPCAKEQLTEASPILIQGKTSTVSTVHRSVYTDVITVKCFDKSGKVVGQHKFIGLYTSSAYNQRPHHIPITRVKVDEVMKSVGVLANSHDGKELYNILETLPRDEIFQASSEEIYRTAVGILELQERLRVRLFVRKDLLGSFYSCLVFVPRDKFNSTLRENISALLQSALGGYQTNFSTRFSDSMLARIHYVVRVKRGQPDPEDSLERIEKQIESFSRTWEEEIKTAISEHFGEELNDLYFKRYGKAFPVGYREDFSARMAVYDIQRIESLTTDRPLAMTFYRPLEELNSKLKFKIFQPGQPIPLSDIVPMLENFGLKVKSECPYELLTGDNKTVWINDFSLSHDQGENLNIDMLRDIFQDAFFNVWANNAESDGFNRLVLLSNLTWREISILRAYAKYLWQIGFTFSQNYVEESLYEHPDIARLLIDLFRLRFDPKLQDDSVSEKISKVEEAFCEAVENVSSLDQDRILRRYRDVILGTLRTNYYQEQTEGLPKPYISFKMDPKAIPDMPKPLPEYEIFVYSPRVEGVHLRTSNVARGGLRWSDRREDFRTEVLGLVKAQRVKNSVIVPMGAKGGFYPKNLPLGGTREEIMEEGIACYKTFIRGLLDVTDNLVDNAVIPPKNVIRHDEDDYYLVVAADKGTATFSDIANSISQEYNFWLGDAFASGGSVGYDHKGMGITARGAWESVKRHFKEMGVDCQKEDFTVIGIGDMSGDVFGNGMLLSEHIRLLAAFNHMHIFIDPNPEAKASFEERKRLFELPRSQWRDYNPELISKGGGVFNRSAKSIPVSQEMKEAFGIEVDAIEPNKLIKKLLTAKVDLLWNGGIGTYVKSKLETHREVGDRANDMLRIDGADLNCAIVGEGGNLGFTQLARVEYSLKGGRLNTDAIDNSAGVDCSDHEVNIKILLNELVHNGDMTEKQRNALLVEMTDEVADLCLENNRRQTEALSVAMYNGHNNIEMYKRLMSVLEAEANLDLALEFLPDSEGMVNRKAQGKGLCRPEISVLMAYVKIALKEQILESKIPEESYAFLYLESAFPKVLKSRYEQVMRSHRLYREIIATQLSNALVNEVGINFVQRLVDETGAKPCDIVRGYIVAREVLDVAGIRESILNLDCSVDSEYQSQMLYEINRLTRRATRWFLRHRQHLTNIEETVKNFKGNIEAVAKLLPTVLKAGAREAMEETAAYYQKAGVPAELAYRIGGFGGLFSALDIVEATLDSQLPIQQFTQVYYDIGARLQLGWFREEIKHHPVASHWDALARAAFRDSLDTKQRDLSVQVLKCISENDTEACTETWLESHAGQVERWSRMIDELRSSSKRDYTMYSVALRELMDLGQ